MMNKLFSKKFLLGLLAVFLILCPAVPAFAAEPGYAVMTCENETNKLYEADINGNKAEPAVEITDTDTVTYLFVDDSVITIEIDAFEYCDVLETVDFSKAASLTTIDEYAFYECDVLTTVDFSGATALETIGEGHLIIAKL